MTALRTALVLAVLCGAATSAAQSKPPSLSTEQRQALLAAVTAASTAPPPVDDETWPLHLLRASDGSHYVAFSAPAPADLTPDQRLALYVRLEPRAPGPNPQAPSREPQAASPEPQALSPTTPTTLAPRSAVEEWLLGRRRDPLPMQANRIVSVPSGEMPVGGLAATSTRDGSGQNSAALGLLARRREKERTEQEARERARREELEGRTLASTDLFPFEDFDLAARVVAVPGGRPVFRRALTAGPGRYDIVVSWAVLDTRNRPASTGAVRRAVTFPAAQSASLALGSLIIADAIRPQTTPYTAEQQTAHPYTIGGTDIEPAADHLFTNDERLAVAFQILNASASPAGKPDVAVTLRLFRQTATGEEPSAALAPLTYAEGTLPADFNLAQGHPLLAAFAAPLRSLPRGEYRLAIVATDRLARTSATAETRFRIVATAATLLASAPPLSAPFSRAWFVGPRVLDAALDALAAPTGSPSDRLVTLARERRFVDLMADPPAGTSDAGTAALLQSVAAYALGDTARALAVQFRRALAAGAPPAATQFFLGAVLAMEGHDEDALAAWHEAQAAGWPADLVLPAVIDAHVRGGRLDEAAALARGALASGVNQPGLARVAAAADIEAGRHARAAETLAPFLATPPDEAETLWVMLHALFAGFAGGEAAAITPEGRARFDALAARYLAAGGINRALAGEWRDLVTSSASAP